ncbi:LTA synthase family protein [Acutalibacter sp. 1XD8-36]|uniref:LTA synthase family protein n=1 Tax=Acutalibacter sp. 1XD8-36 TaxID=2320852 RepID=UPI0026034528|nr:LTA synthase family protein [Acutalibacter sp. 1XD8-36]
MKEKRFLRLSLSRGNFFAAGAVLLASAVFFILEWPLAFGKNTAGQQGVCWWYVLAFSGLSAGAAGACFLEFSLPGAARQGIAWLMILLLPLGSFVAVDTINGTKLWQFSGRRWFANYLCYLLVFALAYALTRRPWAAVAIGGAASLTFGIANYFVVQFRGQPILPWDFTSFGTALTVSGGYEYVPTRKMAVAVLCYLCTVVLCIKIAPQDTPHASRRFHIAERLAAMSISVLLAITLFPLNGLSYLDISVWAWNQKGSSELIGVAASFFANAQYMTVDVPEGYSNRAMTNLSQKLDRIPSPAPLGQPGEAPTVIAIMNESMTDFGSFGTLEFSQDNMPNIHKLQNSGDIIWGTAYSSVYGGNTCNSEYEFLTGNSMAFLPSGSKPYQQYIDAPQQSLAHILKSRGYHTVAIHPGDRKAWERIDAYPHLGFDEFMDATIFDVPRSFEHRLTSDRSCYEQLIYEYEYWRALGDTPLFLFNVTIQNHGGYEDENYETTVQVEGREGRWPRAEQYLSLTKKSDEAIQYLLDYFEDIDEPVVVLFFGDHWPKLEDGFNQAVLKGYNVFTDMYRVPFFIWANYPLEGQEIEAVSLNYLSGLLLRAADIEGTPYTNYLEQLRKDIPVVTDIGVMDSLGDFYVSGGYKPPAVSKKLREYSILQYNNSFDDSRRSKSLFYLEEPYAMRLNK